MLRKISKKINKEDRFFIGFVIANLNYFVESSHLS